ncbi:RDD family protein [Nonomuraea turkmeniaca]|uniref:RDD family protein n=2 Tax=Nonomuraea turkmeniaca TaxID=103838 RepID=A0A5S4EX93_9ACTN|nr:RDD family protein [Nonomuraea turkmeniaca]
MVILYIVSWVISLVFTNLLVASYSSTTGVTTGFFMLWVVTALAAVVTTAIWVAYDFFLTKMKGQTVGKMIMGIKVVPVGQGMPPEGLPTDMALKRAGFTWGGWLLNLVPLIGFLFAWVAIALNGASQLWNKPLQQTFADKFARTVVVKIK